MISTESSDTSEFGCHLVDSISISQEKLNLLFAALFVTSLAVFVGGNLLLWDGTVLLRSAQMALPCFALPCWRSSICSPGPQSA